VYARLSQDDGSKESTDRQVADCRAWCGLHKHAAAGPYVDRDLSAFSGVSRPQFERLLLDLEAGVVDGVVAWKFDRLVRRPRDFERLWAITEPRGQLVAAAVEPIDTSSDFGPFIARMLVGMAEMESKTISRRVRRAKEQARLEGRPKHGGHRGFGHERDGQLVPSEAALIREAAAAILSGSSVHGLAMDWARRGVRTPTGGPWGPPKIRRMLMQARLAGAREDADRGWHSTGAIIPILSEQQVRQLRAVLADPRRVTNHGRVGDALLTGILHCGSCGSKMTTGRVGKRRMYQCRNRPDRPGCGKVSVSLGLADADMAEAVLVALETPEVAVALNRRDDDAADAVADRLLEDRRALERLARDFYVERAITDAEFAAARSALTDRIEQAERSLSRGGGVVIDPASVRAEWERRDLDWRRSLVRLLIERVDCAPATKPYSRWNPDRLSARTTYSA
jgi:DNA invertase Pin-like site-specific DNA recombinase